VLLREVEGEDTAVELERQQRGAQVLMCGADVVEQAGQCPRGQGQLSALLRELILEYRETLFNKGKYVRTCSGR
jgi:hypothetical protein